MTLTLQDFESLGAKGITNAEEFAQMLQLEKVVVYFSADWSGQERTSRRIVHQSLQEIERKEVPVLTLDYSDNMPAYLVEWHKQQGFNNSTPFHGHGEVALFKKGKLADIMRYPHNVGVEGVKQRLQGWLLKD